MKRYTFEAAGKASEGWDLFDWRFKIGHVDSPLWAERICKAMNDIEDADKPFLARYPYNIPAYRVEK